MQVLLYRHFKTHEKQDVTFIIASQYIEISNDCIHLPKIHFTFLFRSNIPEFQPCPESTKMNDTLQRLCGPLNDNSKNCEPLAQQHVHTSCRVFEICDQAVIISGGWNK